MPPPPETEADLEPVPDDGLTVYRVVKVDDVESGGFLDSFRSSGELGLPPRGPEVQYPLIRAGISVWDSRAGAERIAVKFPATGDFVAALSVPPGAEVTWARWGPRGHLTLWGDPLILSQTSADIFPVNREGDH